LDVRLMRISLKRSRRPWSTNESSLFSCEKFQILYWSYILLKWLSEQRDKSFMFTFSIMLLCKVIAFEKVINFKFTKFLVQTMSWALWI
jgi:hypothetical protein